MPDAAADDFVAAFAIEDQPVRGRVVRLGRAVDEVLSRHEYPAPVATLLGEACALAALVGASLKFEGRLIVQAQGDGPVAYVVADYDTAGLLRGFCRFDPDRVAQLALADARPGAAALLGAGTFLMTIDQGPDMERYQGVTPIDGETLALCAEAYFAQSEQIPTRVRLVVGQADAGEGLRWRAGGILIQNIAEDAVRASTADAWRRAQAFFVTIAEDELIDPTISAETLLWRLFHEDGVRLFKPAPLAAFCRCSPERIATVLGAFPPEERDGMVGPDGRIRVTCEYCARVYEIPPRSLDAGQPASGT